jgi:hypothetical protein
MTKGERTEAILKSAEWWDREVVVGAVWAWFLDWRPHALRIPASQWGAAHRVGTGAAGYRGFADAWEEFLRGPMGRDGERHGGVVDRDKKRRGWGQPALADDLWMAIGRAAESQESEKSRRFETEAKQLGPRAEEQLRDWRRLRQARLFVDSLVTMVRTELKARETT